MKPRTNQGPVVAAVYIAAMFMAILDTTIVNVALPTLGRHFHAAADGVGLVSIAYLVSLAVFIPASGWLGDRIGGRNALLVAVALFTAASALCGLATSLDELIVFRVLQGAGGAVMTPVGLAMLFRIYPPAERVRVASIVALFTTLGPALGPILGGIFTTEISWRLVFFVNVPVGIAAFILGAIWLAEHRPDDPGRLDRQGLLLSGLGFGAAMYGISEGPIRGWANPIVLLPITVGTVLLAALVAVELRSSHPLIDLRLLRNRLFRASTCLYAFGSVAYLGALYLAALFFQDALGLTAIQAGLTAFPSAIGTMIGAQLVTRFLYARFSPRRVTTAGLAIAASALLLMALVSGSTNLWVIRLIMLGLGIGISLVFIAAQAASMATVTSADTGRASSMFNAGKQLGGALGVALLSTVLAAGPARHVGGVSTPTVTAFHDGFLAAAAVAALTIAVAWSIRDADAASTMTSTHRSPFARRRRTRAGSWFTFAEGCCAVSEVSAAAAAPEMMRHERYRITVCPDTPTTRLTNSGGR
jgi:EmrB/QacA subfamily drug resistance transporter